MAGSLGWQELLILWILALPLIGLGAALATAGRHYPDSFINRSAVAMESATPARRLSGHLLDGLIGLLTLGVGWFIWLAIVAPRGQSPGKALVGTYIVRSDATIAGAGLVWLRELLVKGLLLWFIGLVTAGLGYLLLVVGGLWCLWDQDKQCLWDKITSTYIGSAPTPPIRTEATHAPVTNTAEKLRELRGLFDDGLITESEYDSRRKRLVSRL